MYGLMINSLHCVFQIQGVLEKCLNSCLKFLIPQFYSKKILQTTFQVEYRCAALSVFEIESIFRIKHLGKNKKKQICSLSVYLIWIPHKYFQFFLVLLQRHRKDVSNFDRQFTSEKTDLTPTDKVFMMNLDQNEFAGFSFLNPEFVQHV